MTARSHRRFAVHPPEGDDIGPAVSQGLSTEQWGGCEANTVQSRTYEITFAGQAGTALRAEFDDCDVSVGQGTTTLRAEIPDQGALQGLLQRITSLGLDLLDVSLTAPGGAADF